MDSDITKGYVVDVNSFVDDYIEDEASGRLDWFIDYFSCYSFLFTSTVCYPCQQAWCIGSNSFRQPSVVKCVTWQMRV